jgi:hypothetical protein
MLAITPVLDVTPAASGTVIEAHVVAERPTPLRWRLVVISGAPRNQSQIAQGGRTDGSSPAVLSRVMVTGSGDAVLEVYQDDILVSETRRRFGAEAP